MKTRFDSQVHIDKLNDPLFRVTYIDFLREHADHFFQKNHNGVGNAIMEEILEMESLHSHLSLQRECIDFPREHRAFDPEKDRRLNAFRSNRPKR